MRILFIDGTPAPLSNYVKKEQNFNEEFTVGIKSL